MYVFHAILESAQSQDCAAHSQNPEIACKSWVCAANLETAQYVCVISELRNTFAKSRDCASAICERNGITGWGRPSWLTEESWELSEMVMPCTGALHRSGISVRLPSLRGREFHRVGELPRSPWCGGLSIRAWHWRWRRSCKSLLRTSLTFIYDGNSKGSVVRATEIALSRDCALVPHDIEIAYWCCAISRLAHNFGILRLRKFLDCAEHNALPGFYLTRSA